MLSDIFSIKTTVEFEAAALEIFRYQNAHVPVYREYLKLLGIQVEAVRSVTDIPFLPIEFFKSHTIIDDDPTTFSDKSFRGAGRQGITFTSSGTSGTQTSSHFVKDVGIYRKSFFGGFDYFYGALKDYAILALLPTYLERDGSSLVYMVEALMEESGQRFNGFFLYDHDALIRLLSIVTTMEKKSILFGVPYALLDLLEKGPFSFPLTTIIETGGMKGRRKEMVREELHEMLKNGFGVETVHAEYGMTELLSQAYSQGDGRFRVPLWMKIMIREPYDPFAIQSSEKTGGINVIDLANYHSCAFIATQDLGKSHQDGSFEILGRFDNSDIRGCNLMVEM